jgi:hypothetical protein
LKRVFSSYNLQLVHHARNLLAVAGIRAEVKNQILSSAMGELPPAECEAQVWVEEPDAALAEQILAKTESGPDWTCGCGETLAAPFSHCWNCGAERR